MPISMHYGDPV